MQALVAGWIGSTNLGDELVFAGLRTHLEALGMSPVAVSIAPETTRTDTGVASIGHADPAATPGLWWSSRGADCVVFGGGGLVQDQTSPWNLPFHISRVVGGRFWRKPWAGVGLGIDVLRSRWSTALARTALAGAVGWTVRDHASAAAGRTLGLDPVVAADLALALPAANAEPEDRLVVALRPPTRPGLATARGKAAADPDRTWVQAVAGALTTIAEREGLSIRMVALQPDRDTLVHTLVADQLSVDASLVDGTAENVFDEFARSRAVVTMRYHGAIAALVAERPTVLLDYAQKMGNLAAEVGAGFSTVAPTTAGAHELAATAKHVLGHGDRLPEARTALCEREHRNRALLERLHEAAS